MKTIKISILALLCIGLFSCDCFRHVQGIIIDSETQLPINEVKVGVINEPHIIIYTDSLGKFEFLSKMVGLPICPKVSLTFEKEGYVKTNEKYKSCCTDNIVVILEKQFK